MSIRRAHLDAVRTCHPHLVVVEVADVVDQLRAVVRVRTAHLIQFRRRRIVDQQRTVAAG
jgi:hypothetical protein